MKNSLKYNLKKAIELKAIRLLTVYAWLQPYFFLCVKVQSEHPKLMCFYKSNVPSVPRNNEV